MDVDESDCRIWSYSFIERYICWNIRYGILSNPRHVVWSGYVWCLQKELWRLEEAMKLMRLYLTVNTPQFPERQASSLYIHLHSYLHDYTDFQGIFAFLILVVFIL